MPTQTAVVSCGVKLTNHDCWLLSTLRRSYRLFETCVGTLVGMLMNDTSTSVIVAVVEATLASCAPRVWPPVQLVRGDNTVSRHAECSASSRGLRVVQD